MHPVPGVRLTLVTPDVLTPYRCGLSLNWSCPTPRFCSSNALPLPIPALPRPHPCLPHRSGMLPGYVSGVYSIEECHVDLVRLTQFARARLVLAPARRINVAQQLVVLDGRPPLPYDVLSLNVGITPSVSGVPGADQYTTPVKPISTFAAKFSAVLRAVAATAEPFRVAVVGGGPGGVELACALQHRLTAERAKAGVSAAVTVALISRGPILSDLAPYARRTMLPLLRARGLEVYECPGGAASVGPGAVNLADGTVVAFNECMWCTQAVAASWLAASGLPVDDRGFVLVDEYLRSAGGPGNVFAAGDAATSVQNPRPKAGVYAVRAVRWLVVEVFLGRELPNALLYRTKPNPPSFSYTGSSAGGQPRPVRSRPASPALGPPGHPFEPDFHRGQVRGGREGAVAGLARRCSVGLERLDRPQIHGAVRRRPRLPHGRDWHGQLWAW